MNSDRDGSWSELMTLRDQLRGAINAEQHANTDARRAPPRHTTRQLRGVENARQRPRRHEGGDGLTDRVR
jgi:hypothetical protein